jgi:hypothetical protein
MHQKLDHLEGRHSAVAGLPDEKHVGHSAWAAAQLNELPATGDETLEIWDAASKSWDAASDTGNADSETMGMGHASLHDSEIGL